MKRFLQIFLGAAIASVIAVPVMVQTFAASEATVFHPTTGERKVVEIGDPKAFSGDFQLETPVNNFNIVVSNWVNKITSGGEFTEEELRLIPEAAWYEVEPQIMNILPTDAEVLGFSDIFGGGAVEDIQDIRVCRGAECEPLFNTTNDNGEFGFSVVSRYRTTLSSSMTSTQTTIPVSSIQTFDGTTLTMADLGGVGFFTIEPGSSREEIVKCTTISSSQWATCTRGLAFSGTSEASVVANRKAHNAGSIVVMSNVHYVYEQLADKDTDQTFGGVITFSNYPLSPGTAPTSSAQLVDFAYVNSLAIAGSPTSTETQIGISELATLAEIKLGTQQSGTGAPLVLPAEHATSTPSANVGSQIVISEADGKLNQNWFDLTENVTRTGALVVNNASSTITNLTINTASTTSLVVGTTNPTFDLTDGDGFFGGTATTTENLHTTGICISNNCTTAFSKIRLATSTSVDIDHVNNASETTIFSYTVPGGTLGTGNALKGKMFINNLDQSNAESLVLRLKYGGSTITTAQSNSSGTPTDYNGYLDFMILGAGATGSQEGSLYMFVAADDADVSQSGIWAGHGSASVDSTADQALLLTADFSASSDEIHVTHVVLEVVEAL